MPGHYMPKKGAKKKMPMKKKKMGGY